MVNLEPVFLVWICVLLPLVNCAGQLVVATQQYPSTIVVSSVKTNGNGNATLQILATLPKLNLLSAAAAVDSDGEYVFFCTSSTGACIGYVELSSRSWRFRAVNVQSANIVGLRYSNSLDLYYALIKAGPTLSLFSARADNAQLGITLVGDTSLPTNIPSPLIAAIDSRAKTLVVVTNNKASTQLASIALDSAQLSSAITLWQSGLINLDYDDRMASLVGIVWYKEGAKYYLAKIDATSGSVAFYVAVDAPAKTVISSDYVVYAPGVRTYFVTAQLQSGPNHGQYVCAINIDTGAFSVSYAVLRNTTLPVYAPS